MPYKPLPIIHLAKGLLKRYTVVQKLNNSLTKVKGKYIGITIKSKETSSYTVAIQLRYCWLPTLQAALAISFVRSYKHNFSCVGTSMHAQIDTLSTKSAKFNPYVGGWFVLLIIMPAKVGIKSCRFARDCVSFVHV